MSHSSSSSASAGYYVPPSPPSILGPLPQSNMIIIGQDLTDTLHRLVTSVQSDPIARFSAMATISNESRASTFQLQSSMFHPARHFNVCPPYQSAYTPALGRSANDFNGAGIAGNEAVAILQVGKSFLISRIFSSDIEDPNDAINQDTRSEMRLRYQGNLKDKTKTRLK